MTADPALEETSAQDEGLETFLLQRVMSFDFRGVKLDSEAPGILLYEGLQDPEQLAHEHLENGLPWFYEHEVWEKLDENGVPIVTYQFGEHRNPVTTSQTALAFYARYMETGDEEARQFFLANANWLRENHDGFYFRYDFVWRHANRTLSAGWASGMAQGQSLGVLSRAYHLTGDATYLETANGIFRTLFENTGDDWLFGVDEEGYYWLEEYPNVDFCHVLNGYLFALWGVWDYYAVTDDDFAVTLFRAGLRTLADHILEWNVPHVNSSVYCRHRTVYAFYHDVHLTQLEAYANQFDIPEFRDAIAAFTDVSRPDGVLALTPEALRFDSVEVGETGSTILGLINSSAVPVVVSRMTTTSGRFQFPGLPRTIQRGTKQNVEIRFAPTVPGELRDTLVIHNDTPDSPARVPIEATAIAAEIVLESSRVDVGVVPVGVPTSLQLVIQNSGAAPLRITEIVTPPGVSIEEPPAEIPPGDSWTAEVTVIPETASSFEALIVLHSNALGGPLGVTVAGEGQSTHAISGVGALEFPDVLALEQDSLAFAITNVGDAPLYVRQAVFNDVSFSAEVPPAVVLPGDSAEVLVRFTPEREGAYADTLTLDSNAEEPLRVALRARALSPMVLLHEGEVVTDVSFPGVEVGRPDTLVMHLENRASKPITLEQLEFGADEPFRVLEPLHTVSALDLQPLSVVFAPETTGRFLDTLIVASSVLEQPIRLAVAGMAKRASASEGPGSVTAFRLAPNYPNPFAGSTHIAFEVAEPSPVRILLFDLLGRQVAVLVDDHHLPGRFEREISVDGLPAGIYFLQMYAGERLVGVQKAMVVR